MIGHGSRRDEANATVFALAAALMHEPGLIHEPARSDGPALTDKPARTEGPARTGGLAFTGGLAPATSVSPDELVPIDEPVPAEGNATPGRQLTAGSHPTAGSQPMAGDPHTAGGQQLSAGQPTAGGPLTAAGGQPAWDAVEVAFLDVLRPDIADGYAALVEAGCTQIVAHPFFLFAGRHTARDIPAALAAAQARHAGTTWTITEPLGLHPGVVATVRSRIADRLAADSETRSDPPT